VVHQETSSGAPHGVPLICSLPIPRESHPSMQLFLCLWYTRGHPLDAGSPASAPSRHHRHEHLKLSASSRTHGCMSPTILHCSTPSSSPYWFPPMFCFESAHSRNPTCSTLLFPCSAWPTFSAMVARIQISALN
jgi:hypothetical protein